MRLVDLEPIFSSNDGFYMGETRFSENGVHDSDGGSKLDPALTRLYDVRAL
jgi:hypothetical protein